MDRRNFLGAMAGGVVGKLSAAPTLAIDATTLQAQLTALSAFGRPAGGSFESGVSRVGYSEADVGGRHYVIGLMKETGATVRVDAAGNIFADKPGTQASLPPVLFGSHIDSVPSGGNFDGDLGSLASVQILRVLHENRIQTRRPLSAVVWACEETTFGGRGLNGSRAAGGKMASDELKQLSGGVVKSDAIGRIGGNANRIGDAQIRRDAYHAYVELHIEQGGTLARDRVPLGVVDGIVATDRYEVVISGFANHAGTTPMQDRQDALIAAARLTLAVRETVTAEQGAQVGTVGHLEVSPNAPNVIPGEVKMTVELRDLSSAKLERLAERIKAQAKAIAADTRTQIHFGDVMHTDAATAAVEVQRAIKSAAGKLSLDTRHLPSAAGHDAQIMATLMPMGMIFVPSAGGISHSPKEFTSWQDCANGANVLMQTVLALAV